MTLGVGPQLRESHLLAGQFVEVRLPGEEAAGFFAIANAPDGSTIELLIKRGEGLPERLASLQQGAAVETTAAMGKGFPIDESGGRDILLFATGSGIAPIRAVLQRIAANRGRYQAVELFYGVRSEDEFPYVDEFAQLEERGIGVHRVISQRNESDRAYAGYVQERFRAALPPVGNAVAFLCGQEGMIQGVTEALLEAGLPSDRIHLNL